MLIHGDSLPDFAWSARPYLVAYVRRRSAGQLDRSTDAEDLVQRVYQRAVLHAALLRDRRPVAMRRWLRRTARGVVSYALAAQRARKRCAAERAADAAWTLSLAARCVESPLDLAELSQLEALVRQAVARLPDPYRWIVEQHDLLHRPMADLARECGKTEFAVWALRTRAIGALREALKIK